MIRITGGLGRRMRLAEAARLQLRPTAPVQATGNLHSNTSCQRWAFAVQQRQITGVPSQKR
jgi:hypothetical protein